MFKIIIIVCKFIKVMLETNNILININIFEIICFDLKNKFIKFIKFIFMKISNFYHFISAEPSDISSHVTT